jgi:hypothetical protein
MGRPCPHLLGTLDYRHGEGLRKSLIGSFSFLLALHILFLVSYVLFMPAFEGADEPDHLRYIEAIFNGDKIHPIDPSHPRQYGIEVYQPPLYYHLAASVARVLPVPVVFSDYLAINPDKNPRFPFLVHDEPGEIFPFDPPRRTLRFFRTLSVLFGIAAFVVFAQILHLLMPGNPRGASIVLLVVALWPNNLQVFSVVSNDGLVLLLSLGLVLAVLNCIKVNRPSWKQGLCVGIIFALGLLTKVTILLTAAALFCVVLLDSMLDRRRGAAYLRVLPAVFLPVLLLAGPFIISRIIWYGDPTGEALLKILTPALVRPSPRAFVGTAQAMWEILPGRFLAALFWQQLTLPLISLQLFVLWSFFNVAMGIRTTLFGFRKSRREEVLHAVLVLSSFVFMFVVLYRISADWVGMQFRHVWNLWPMTLVAPYFAIHGLKFLRRVNKDRILNVVFVALMLLLVPINVLLVYNDVVACKPVERLCRADLNYFAFIDYWVQNPHLGLAYLDETGLTDVKAYREFAQNHDWNHALFYARRALERGANQEESRLMVIRALRMLGGPNEASRQSRGEGEKESITHTP